MEDGVACWEMFKPTAESAITDDGIRGVYDYTLYKYKSTFYLLTYLLTYLRPVKARGRYRVRSGL